MEKPVPNLEYAKLVDSTPRIANINESTSKDSTITLSAAYPVQKDFTDCFNFKAYQRELTTIQNARKHFELIDNVR